MVLLKKLNKILDIIKQIEPLARKYLHGEYSGHIDAYFGTGMEFDCSLDQANLNRPFGDWSTSAGCKLLMSHEWPYHFEEITQRYSDAWVQLIYRPDLSKLSMVETSRRI